MNESMSHEQIDQTYTQKQHVEILQTKWLMATERGDTGAAVAAHVALQLFLEEHPQLRTN